MLPEVAVVKKYCGFTISGTFVASVRTAISNKPTIKWRTSVSNLIFPG